MTLQPRLALRELSTSHEEPLIGYQTTKTPPITKAQNTHKNEKAMFPTISMLNLELVTSLSNVINLSELQVKKHSPNGYVNDNKKLPHVATLTNIRTIQGNYTNL